MVGIRTRLKELGNEVQLCGHACVDVRTKHKFSMSLPEADQDFRQVVITSSFWFSYGQSYIRQSCQSTMHPVREECLCARLITPYVMHALVSVSIRISSMGLFTLESKSLPLCDRLIALLSNPSITCTDRANLVRCTTLYALYCTEPLQWGILRQDACIAHVLCILLPATKAGMSITACYVIGQTGDTWIHFTDCLQQESNLKSVKMTETEHFEKKPKPS